MAARWSEDGCLVRTLASREADQLLFSEPPSTVRLFHHPHGRPGHEGQQLYTRAALKEVQARAAAWRAEHPALRGADKTPVLILVGDKAGRRLASLGLQDSLLASARAWFSGGARPGSAAVEARAVLPSHPAYCRPEQSGFPALGLYAARALEAGRFLLLYTGVLCLDAELPASERDDSSASFLFDVDESSCLLADGAPNPARRPLVLEGAPAFGLRSSPAPCLAGLANGQAGMPTESVNLLAVTLLGRSCCPTCPPFPHPHIAFCASRAVQAGAELVLDYGQKYFAEGGPPPPVHRFIPVACEALRGLLDLKRLVVWPLAAPRAALSLCAFRLRAGARAQPNKRAVKTVARPGAADGEAISLEMFGQMAGLPEDLASWRFDPRLARAPREDGQLSDEEEEVSEGGMRGGPAEAGTPPPPPLPPRPPPQPREEGKRAREEESGMSSDEASRARRSSQAGALVLFQPPKPSLAASLRRAARRDEDALAQAQAQAAESEREAAAAAAAAEAASEAHAAAAAAAVAAAEEAAAAADRAAQSRVAAAGAAATAAAARAAVQRALERAEASAAEAADLEADGDDSLPPLVLRG